MNEDLNGLMFFSFSVSFQRERMCFLKRIIRDYIDSCCHLKPVIQLSQGVSVLRTGSPVFGRDLWLLGEVKPPPLPAGGSVPQRRLWRSWRQFKVKMAPQARSQSSELRVTRMRQQKRVIKVQECCHCEENLCWNIIGVGEMVRGSKDLKGAKEYFYKIIIKLQGSH